MNKRANLPVLILVIGVFSLAALAMFTFFVSDFKMGNTFVGVGTLEKVNSQMDEYIFYKNNGVEVRKLDNLFNVTEEDGVRYLKSELDYESFSFFKKNERIVLFSVKMPIQN